jgi:hypothetical protein
MAAPGKERVSPVRRNNQELNTVCTNRERARA